MSCIAVIGGSGLTKLDGLKIVHREVVHTPYGEPSGPFTHGELFGNELIFLPRHGVLHTIPPHKINYRANLWALKHIGVSRILAVAAVGGISENMAPGRIAIPDQIIDYTYSRAHTFFENDLSQVTHIDFTHPYDERLRELILEAGKQASMPLVDGGVYGATQGPRLETKAEIKRLEQDGCTMVGMTGMPEAALAREIELDYATIAVSANWAAGKGGEAYISLEEIEKNLNVGMDAVRQLLKQTLCLMD